MKKFTAVCLVMIFTPFVSLYALSPEVMLKDFHLSAGSSQNLNQGPEFSLKADYSGRLIIKDPSAYGILAQDEAGGGKSKVGNWVGAVACIAIGGFLVYKFATYEAKETKNQLGEVIGHEETNSMTQFSYIIGALICGGIAAYLIAGAVRKQESRVFDLYEKELKAAARYNR